MARGADYKKVFKNSVPASGLEKKSMAGDKTWPGKVNNPATGGSNTANSSGSSATDKGSA